MHWIQLFPRSPVRVSPHLQCLVKKEWVEVIFTDGHLTLQVSCITSSIPLERLHRVYAWACLQREGHGGGVPGPCRMGRDANSYHHRLSCPAVQHATRVGPVSCMPPVMVLSARAIVRGKPEEVDLRRYEPHRRKPRVCGRSRLIHAAVEVCEQGLGAFREDEKPRTRCFVRLMAQTGRVVSMDVTTSHTHQTPIVQPCVHWSQQPHAI
jgi:hypothetical protein